MENVKSILVGNGVNINFGGRAYTNEFIIKRIVFNARSGKYAPIFGDIVSGESIATLFSELANWTNDIVNGQYDSLIIEKDDVDALKSFKARYSWNLNNYYEVGLEDWFFILRVFFLSSPAIMAEWNSAKQGFEQMMLDAIYNDGDIQQLYCFMNEQVKKFFSSYDNIFTLNYDNNIEMLSSKKVIHLHGDYRTLANSENPETILGFIRAHRGECTVVPRFEHCYCNALFDYSGEHKYTIATAFEKGEKGLAALKNSYMSEKFLPAPIAEVINVHRAHPELSFGVQYHFDALKTLTGELHIIGVSPNNDSHIFKLIDESQVTKIVFYYHSEADKSLSIHKSVDFMKVDELWKALKAAPKKYSCRYSIPSSRQVDRFLPIFNSLSADSISKETLIAEINSIPQFKVDKLCKMVHEKLTEQVANRKTKSERDLMRQFREISRIALREGVLPSALYTFVIMNASKWKTDDYN